MPDTETPLLDTLEDVDATTSPEDVSGSDDSSPESPATPTGPDSSATSVASNAPGQTDEPEFWRQRLAAAGYSQLPDSLTPDSIVQFLAAQRQEALVNRQTAHSYYERLRQQAALQQQGQMHPQPQPARQETQAERWSRQYYSLPEIDKAWVDEWVQDGEFKPETPPEMRQKITDHFRTLRAHQDKFWQDPHTFMEPGVRHIVREEAERISREAVERYQQQQWANNTHNQMEWWAYEHGADGQALRLMDGQPVLSASGQRFMSINTYLKDVAKVADPNVRYAMTVERMTLEDMAAAARQQNPAQPAPTIAQTQAAAQAAHLQRHTGTKPPRGGSFRGQPEGSDVPQNGSKILNNALRWFTEHGGDLAAPAA